MGAAQGPSLAWHASRPVTASRPVGGPPGRNGLRLRGALAVGALAVVFGTGNDFQTNITTDGGQFQSLSGAYLAAPARLP